MLMVVKARTRKRWPRDMDTTMAGMHHHPGRISSSPGDDGLSDGMDAYGCQSQNNILRS
jgi:hypothetical protein